MRPARAAVALLALAALLAAGAAAGGPPASSAELHRRAEAAQAAGDVEGALAAHSALVRLEPRNPYHRLARSTAQLRLRRYAAALADLDAAAELEPGLAKARSTRASVLLLLGRCDEAREEAAEAARLGSSSAQATRDKAARCEAGQARAAALLEAERWAEAKQALDAVLAVAHAADDLLADRAGCAVELGRPHDVLADTKEVLSRHGSHLRALAFRGAAYFLIGELDVAVSHFKRGIKSDPEHRLLKRWFRRAKKLKRRLESLEKLRQRGRWKDAAAELLETIESEPAHEVLLPQLYLKLCEARTKAGDGEGAIKACDEVVAREPRNLDALMQRGEARIVAEQYEEAIKDYEQAAEFEPNNRRVKQGMQRAQMELKKSKRKNHYKTLGVKRTATNREIKKAFRKLALEVHPDKAPQDEKEAAEDRFREIGEAYEVLVDDEKRRRYDNGEDIEMDQGWHPHQHFRRQHHHGGRRGGGGGGGGDWTFTF